jgi:hypothetical protein
MLKAENLQGHFKMRESSGKGKKLISLCSIIEQYMIYNVTKMIMISQ